jgi:L-malate glycosyltransferase
MKRRLNVMQIIWSFIVGGAEVYALTVASGLDARQYRSLMCATDEGGSLEAEIWQRGIPSFVLRRRPGIELRLMWRLYRLFRRHRVDVVQTHHFTQLFYGALGARLAGARLIHTEHSTELYQPRRRRIALRLLSLLCDKVIAIGGDSAHFLREQVGIAAHKLEVIRAGVDADAFTASRSESRAELGLDEADRVAVVVARLEPVKNHRLLLAAFAEAARRVERARLLVVGEGAERDAIRAEIHRLGLGDRVRMLGVRRDVARILAASDVFVLASDREGLPIAALEAMAAARPVVVTSVGDLPAVVSDGVNGRLVPPGDGAALAAAMTQLLGDSELAAEMGERARRFVAQHHTTRAMLDQYHNLYAPEKR